MNPERLLQNFDRLVDTPDAVPRLRRFILDLAVRGKLVEQNPEDEPATELLKIATESVEVPFELPNKWVSARAGNLLNIQYGKSRSAKDRSDQGSVPVYGSNGVVGYCEEALAKESAIIIGRKGSAGALNLCAGPSWTTDVAYFLIPPNFLNIRFLFVILQTLDLGRLGKGVKPGLSRTEAYELSIAVPPLAEQHRIVTKVDELMKLCDELEATQAKRERRLDRLVAATLHGLNNGKEENENGETLSFEDSARFYFNHLPRLITRREHIQQLRQTILSLAVRGKLVAQNPKYESVAEFLKRIESEKTRLSKEGQLRGDTSVTPLDAAEGPFVIPSSWAWVPFGDIMVSRDGERIPVSKEERHGRAKNYDYYGASGVIDKIDTYLFDKPLLLIGEDGANLINRSTPIAFIARGKYWVNNHAHVLDGISEEFLRFIELHINAIDLKPYVTGTAQPKMNQAKMNSIPIALPPEDEQHRIVAKVDALMALCNDLERQITTHTTTSRKFLETTLQAVLQGRGMHECTFQ